MREVPRDDSSVAALVERAGAGDESAWDHIVRRYSPLVGSVCRRCGVTGADAEDVGGIVWLRLVMSLRTLREPAALPGWLTTSTRRECVALLRRLHREVPLEIQDGDGPEPVEPAPDVPLLAEERRVVLRRAFARLPDHERRLLHLLFADPPNSYLEISLTLGIPVGSIGPNRRRSLARLRRNPGVAALLLAERAALS